MVLDGMKVTKVVLMIKSMCMENVNNELLLIIKIIIIKFF